MRARNPRTRSLSWPPGSLNLFDKLETFLSPPPPSLSLSRLHSAGFRLFFHPVEGYTTALSTRVFHEVNESTIFQTRHAFNHGRRKERASSAEATLYSRRHNFLQVPINSVFMLIRSPSRGVTSRRRGISASERAGAALIAFPRCPPTRFLIGSSSSAGGTMQGEVCLGTEVARASFLMGIHFREGFLEGRRICF